MDKANSTPAQTTETKNHLVKAAILVTVIGLLLVLFPWKILDGLSIGRFYLDITEYDSLATFFSGITVPFLSLSTILLLIRTYQLQNQQLQEQKKQAKKQEDSLAKQQFEQRFFQMLNMHNQIVDAMDLRKTDQPEIIISVKKDCIKRMYQTLKERCTKDNSIKKAIEEYNLVQNHYKADLHHYYTFAYRILKYINESRLIDEDEKYEYTSLFRAQFSPYELAMFFYNGLHDFGKNAYPLLNQYSFFNNLDDTLLISKLHLGKYHDVAFGDWNGKTREENLANWLVKQEKVSSNGV